MKEINQIVFEDRDQWLAARRGRFTSSEITRLLAGKDDELSTGAMTYILEAIAGEYAEPKPEFYNAAMQWGNDQEPQAVMALCERLGIEITDPDIIYTSVGGFVFFTYGEIAGGTPDMIMPGYCVELKCPDSDTHLYYRLFLTAENFQKELPKYYAQMQFNMLLTNRNRCLFVSFDPRFKNTKHQLFILEIPANKEFQEKIIKKIELAEAKKIELLNILNHDN